MPLNLSLITASSPEREDICFFSACAEEGSCELSDGGRRAGHSLVWGVFHDSSLQMGRAGSFLAACVKCMISCLFWARGQHWGALFALHLPRKQQHWFLLPETLNKWNYSRGLLPCLSPREEKSRFSASHDETYLHFPVYLFL